MQPSNKGLHADEWLLIAFTVAILHIFFMAFFTAGFANWADLDRGPATIAWMMVVVADMAILAVVVLTFVMRALLLLSRVAYRWKRQGRAPQQPEVSRETEH